MLDCCDLFEESYMMLRGRCFRLKVGIFSDWNNQMVEFSRCNSTNTTMLAGFSSK